MNTKGHIISDQQFEDYEKLKEDQNQREMNMIVERIDINLEHIYISPDIGALMAAVEMRSDMSSRNVGNLIKQNLNSISQIRIETESNDSMSKIKSDLDSIANTFKDQHKEEIKKIKSLYSKFDKILSESHGDWMKKVIDRLNYAKAFMDEKRKFEIERENYYSHRINFATGRFFIGVIITSIIWLMYI